MTKTLAHAGEGHTEEELQTSDHTEAKQSSQTAVQATTTQPTNAVTPETKKANVNTTFGILFVCIALAIVVTAVVIAFNVRTKK